MSQPVYTIEPIEESDINNVLHFLQRNFYLDEPLNNAIGLCIDTGAQGHLDSYCRKSLVQGVSFKAVDKDFNIVGCLVNGIDSLKKADDGHDMMSLAKKCTEAKMQKILYLIAIREENAKLWEKFPNEEKLIDIKIASTDSKWRKKGIMNELVTATEKKAKELGINLLKIDTSSAYSAKSAEKCGFTSIHKAAYTDIKMDGQPIIVPEEPHIYDEVFIKTLNLN